MKPTWCASTFAQIDLGYSISFGPDIAPDGEYPERQSYKEVVLINRLKIAIAKINPNIFKIGIIKLRHWLNYFTKNF